MINVNRHEFLGDRGNVSHKSENSVKMWAIVNIFTMMYNI